MKKPLHIHFMGIGGSGASSVALLAKAYGFKVSGCDLEESKSTRLLTRDGVEVSFGHDESHLKGVDILAHSSAVFYQSADNPEYLKAKKAKKSMIWEEFMARYLQTGKYLIAVAGTHGKGTTSAMLSVILEKAGLDPMCEIGVSLLDWDKKNYRVGLGKYFVCEADEFREKFLLYHPNMVIVTSIEMDHPEYFADVNQIITSFEKFILGMKSPATIIIYKGNKNCLELVKRLKAKKFSGKIILYDKIGSSFKLKLPGVHIKQDAGGAAMAAKVLKVKDIVIKKALESFSGCERRFEYKGESVEGFKVYDDYAHHPTAVKVNIDGARKLFPKSQILVVFQPHMYTRLRVLFDDFAKSLRLADKVIVTDVYSKREQNINTPTGKDLAIAIGDKATYVGGDLQNIVNFVKRNGTKKDVVVVMGAGDSYKIAEGLV